MDVETAIKVAKNKKSTPDQLKELLGLSDEVDLLLAKHQNTTAEMLDDICWRQSFDEKIAPVALVHPNLNVGQLLDVGVYHPLAAYKNPKFLGLVAKDKKFLDQFDSEEFENSFKKPLPDFVVEWLISRGKAAYQLTYISAPNRRPEELLKFRESKHPKVVATLLDKDLATYLRWAADIGIGMICLDRLPESEARACIDRLISQVVHGNVSSPAIPYDRTIELVLPQELFAVLAQIESIYFRNGRIVFGPEHTFYGEFVDLLDGVLMQDSIFTKLVEKVNAFDLGEMRRFANPGKKPPADIGKARYYVKSGLERSFHRLSVALARVYQGKGVASHSGLGQALRRLIAAHPLPAKQRQIGAKESDLLVAKPKDIDIVTLLEWAKDLGFALPPSNDGNPVDEKFEFENWADFEGLKISELAKQLVPKSGHADSLQGELVRAISRLEAEYYQNGNMNWGDGSNFYENFARLIHTTLKAEKSFSKLALSLLDIDIAAIRKSGTEGKEIASVKMTREEVFSGIFFVERDVERSYLRLKILIAKWCERNLSPRPYESIGRS